MAIRNATGNPCGRPAAITAILAEVAYRHHMSVTLMLTRSNEPHLVRARREAMRKLKSLGLSTPAIGRYMGGLHHSTVVHHLHHPEPVPEPESNEIPVPDESGIWAI